MLRTTGPLGSLAPLVLTAFAGCGTLGTATTPMLTLERLPARCEGGTTLEDLGAPAPAHAAATATNFEVGVYLLRMAPEVATAALGVKFPGVDAQVVDAAGAAVLLQGLLADERLVLLHEAALTLASGQSGHVTIANEVSYITGFELEAVPGASLVDPVIETREFGARVELAAQFEDEAGPWALDVAVESVEPLRPTPIVAIRAPGSGLPLEIQTPIFNRVRLDTTATVSLGRLLVLAGPDAGVPGEVLVALIVPNPDDILGAEG